jgi:hypothetical protein
MHEKSGILIATAIAVLGFAAPVAAQKDAATRAQEGGVDHWIEYYRKNQPSKPAEVRPPAEPPAPRGVPDNVKPRGKK